MQGFFKLKVFFAHWAPPWGPADNTKTVIEEGIETLTLSNMKEDVAGSQYLPGSSSFDIPSSIAINRHVQTIQYTKAGYLRTLYMPMVKVS